MGWTDKPIDEGAMWLLVFLLAHVWLIIDPPKFWRYICSLFAAPEDE